MNWLDIVIIIIVAIPVFIGLKRGLLGTLVPLLGIILAVILAGRFYGSISGLLDNWLQSESQAKIVGFIVIFILVMIVVLVAASLARKFLNLLFLGWVDRIGGVVFGLIIGCLIAGAFLSIISNFFSSRVEGTVSDSAIAAFLLDKLPFVLLLLPGEFDAVRQFFG